MTKALEAVPVRRLHKDRSLTQHYLYPDGTECFDPPLEVKTTKSLTLPEITDVNSSHGSYDRIAMGTLLHLSDLDPFLFEEVLTFLENGETSEKRFLAYRISTLRPYSKDDFPAGEDHREYRAAMKLAPLLMELYRNDGDSWLANDLLDTSRGVVGFGHPYLDAVVLAHWIMLDQNPNFTMDYFRYREDLTYISSHMREVMDIRHELARRKTIRMGDIESLLENVSPLRGGTL